MKKYKKMKNGKSVKRRKHAPNVTEHDVERHVIHILGDIEEK